LVGASGFGLGGLLLGGQFLSDFGAPIMHHCRWESSVGSSRKIGGFDRRGRRCSGRYETPTPRAPRDDEHLRRVGSRGNGGDVTKFLGLERVAAHSGRRHGAEPHQARQAAEMRRRAGEGSAAASLSAAAATPKARRAPRRRLDALYDRGDEVLQAAYQAILVQTGVVVEQLAAAVEARPGRGRGYREENSISSSATSGSGRAEEPRSRSRTREVRRPQGQAEDGHGRWLRVAAIPRSLRYR